MDLSEAYNAVKAEFEQHEEERRVFKVYKKPGFQLNVWINGEVLLERNLINFTIDDFSLRDF